MKFSNMAPLDKALFTGKPHIDGVELAKGEVTNHGISVDNALKNFHWNGKAIGVVVLKLSPDNRRIDSAEFVSRGELEDKEIRMDCSKLWQDADLDTTITIRFPKCDNIKYTEGGLWSDFLPDNEILHYYHVREEDRTPSPILAADLDKWGIGHFCARMVCQISKSSSVNRGVVIKYQLFLYPGTKEEILGMCEAAVQGSWPGLKVAEGEFPLGPLPGTAWQCPLVPLLQPGTSFEQIAVAPTSEKMRSAIGAVMSKTSIPEGSKSLGALHAKWDRIKRSPLEAASKLPQASWPKPTEHPPDEGN